MSKEVKIIVDDNNDYTKYFHTDMLLSDEYVNNLTYASDREKPLLECLLKIHGVQSVSIDRYKVRVERSKAIAWDGITPEILKAIKDFCSTLVEAG